MSEDQRKASEIILSIESKLDNMLKTMGSYETNTKLILDRVNKVYLYIEEVKKSYSIVQENEENFTNLDEPISISKDPIINKRSAKPLPDANGLQNPYKMDGFNEVKKIETVVVEEKNSEIISDKKVPVIQRITDQTGKDIFMADVLVCNSKQEAIYKTKTNAIGKWQAHLRPGAYTINVSKTDMNTKKKLEIKQEINIPASNATVVLDALKITR